MNDENKFWLSVVSIVSISLMLIIIFTTALVMEYKASYFELGYEEVQAYGSHSYLWKKVK